VVSVTDRNLVSELACETSVWMGNAPRGARPDVCGEVWAFALATFVDGVPITPKGYDESDELRTHATDNERRGSE
jgi:hypothetical protein